MLARSRRLTMTIAVVAALASGCGSGSAQPASPGTAASAGAGATSAPSLEIPPADLPVPVIEGKDGGPAGSGLITVVEGGTVTATADDGTVYTLDIPPGAVGEDVTVEVRPLSGTSDLGPIVAGADFAPAGLQLLLPGTLSVQLAGGAPAGIVALSYAGDRASTPARLLLSPGSAVDQGAMTFSVPHFSGSVAVSTGASAASLATKWAGAKDAGTPSGRQAVAETRYAAADLAEREGRISKDSAAEIKARAETEWLEAEHDRILEEARDFESTAARAKALLEHERARQLSGGKADPETERTVTDLLEQELRRELTELAAGKATQEAINSGRVGALKGLQDKIAQALSIAKIIEVRGGDASDSMALIASINKRYVEKLLESCDTMPLDPVLIVTLKRDIAVAGDEESAGIDMAQLAKCAGEVPKASIDYGPFAADGTIKYFFSQESFDGRAEYAVTLELKVREGEEAVIFGKGSRFSARYTFIPGEVRGDGGELVPYTCPTSYAWEGTVGTLSNGEGWDPGSNPSPLSQGFAMQSDPDLELSLEVSAPEGALEPGCPALSVAIECPGDDFLTGTLVGSLPPEWSFACSDSGDDWVESASGRMTRVVGVNPP